MSQRAVAGTVIEGKYRLEKQLGAGGMGAVWLATQLMVDRNVAVKLLHPAFIDSDDLQARFEVEAKAIGRLSHPNCITLFDFGYSDDLRAFYTVIEYVNGDSLDKRLTENLSVEAIVSIMKDIALALDHAHHQGILHRDLKPENVMLARMTDGSEIVKVLDFGIARIVKGDAAQDAERITKAGEVFGTPAYMSPEQARSIRQLSPAADLYSLGVMFYELVAGQLPFFSNSAFDLLMMHVTKPVPPIQREDVPADVKALIMRLLDKTPENRPQTGKELADLLGQLDLSRPSFPTGPRRQHVATPTLMGPPDRDDGDFASAPTEAFPMPQDPDDIQRVFDSDLSASVTTPFVTAQPAQGPFVTVETPRDDGQGTRVWLLAGIVFLLIATLGLVMLALSPDDEALPDVRPPIAESDNSPDLVIGEAANDDELPVPSNGTKPDDTNPTNLKQKDDVIAENVEPAESEKQVAEDKVEVEKAAPTKEATKTTRRRKDRTNRTKTRAKTDDSTTKTSQTKTSTKTTSADFETLQLEPSKKKDTKIDSLSLD